MAKLTNEDIAKTNVVRATFENGTWIVLVSDESGFIYRVDFEGEENESNDSLLLKVHNGLLEEDKYEAPVIVEPTVRDTIVGLTPKE